MFRTKQTGALALAMAVTTLLPIGAAAEAQSYGHRVTPSEARRLEGIERTRQVERRRAADSREFRRDQEHNARVRAAAVARHDRIERAVARSDREKSEYFRRTHR